MRLKFITIALAIMALFAVTLMAASPPTSNTQQASAIVLTERHTVPVIKLATATYRSAIPNTASDPFYQLAVLRSVDNGVTPETVLLC